MARGHQLKTQRFRKTECFVVSDGPQELESRPPIIDGIQRQGRLVFGQLMLVSELRLFLLKMRRIRQKDSSEIQRRRCGINRAVIALRNESRQISGVIDMRMRENNRIDG